MLRNLFLALCAGTLLLVAGCADNPFEKQFYEEEAETVLPSADPLVLAHFERRLNEKGVAYKRNYEGGYSALHPRDTGELKKVASEFEGQTIESSTLKVRAGCAAQKMQSYLRKEEIVYTVVIQEGDSYLHVSKDDFESHTIAERWNNYEAECGDTDAQ